MGTFSQIRRRDELRQILVMMFVLLPFAQDVAAAQPPERLNVLHMQVMLDRAGFSPGEIDGRMGVIFKRWHSCYVPRAEQRDRQRLL